mgnify:CR=1 FL=1
MQGAVVLAPFFRAVFGGESGQLLLEVEQTNQIHQLVTIQIREEVRVEPPGINPGTPFILHPPPIQEVRDRARAGPDPPDQRILDLGVVGSQRTGPAIPRKMKPIAFDRFMVFEVAVSDPVQPAIHWIDRALTPTQPGPGFHNASPDQGDHSVFHNAIAGISLEIQDVHWCLLHERERVKGVFPLTFLKGDTMVESMDLEPFRQFIEALARDSEAVINPLFRNDALEVVVKGDDTPVTQADRGAEEVIRRRINETYPEHGIIGEEYGEENPDADFVWVLDPVDGTFSFTYGIPLFGTLICLKHEGRPVLGAIHQPFLRELVIGSDAGTTLNGQPVRCSDVDSIDRALLLTTDPRRPSELKPDSNFEGLAGKCRLFRTWGDAYGYLMVACGRAEIMTDPIVKEWDFVGHIPIIRGAGGIITDWEGNDPVGASSVVCANAPLHPRVMEILHG